MAPLVVVALEWKLLSPIPALADHFQFWAAGQLALTGRSPYERESWVAMAAYGPLPDGAAVNTVIGNLALTRYVWLYPPQTALAFVPFGALPVGLGVQLLHVLLFAAAVAGVILAARAVGLMGARLAFALTLAAISQPFVIGVRDGHPVGLVLAGAVLAYVGLRDRRPWPLALGVALVSLKPHVAIAFAVAALAYTIRRDPRALAVAGTALALVTIPAELLYPFPLAVLASATSERSALDVSSTGALARDLGDGPALTVAIALIAVGAAVTAFRLAPRVHHGTVAVGAALALSLVLVPYAHDYDQLLVLPAAFAALSLAHGSRDELAVSALVAALVALVPWVLFFWWPLVGQGDRVYQGGALGALPVLVLIGLGISALAARRSGPPAPGPPAA